MGVEGLKERKVGRNGQEEADGTVTHSISCAPLQSPETLRNIYQISIEASLVLRPPRKTFYLAEQASNTGL